MAHEAEAGHRPHCRLQPIGRAVGRAVVDAHDFEIAPVGERRRDLGDERGDVLRFVQHRQDDADRDRRLAGSGALGRCERLQIHVGGWGCAPKAPRLSHRDLGRGKG